MRRAPWSQELFADDSEPSYDQLDDDQRLAAVSLNFDDFAQQKSPAPDLLNNAFRVDDDNCSGTTLTDSAEEDIPAQQPLPVRLEDVRNYMSVTAPIKVAQIDAVRGAQHYMESVAYDMDVADFNHYVATIPDFVDTIIATNPPDRLFNVNCLVLKDNCQFKWLHAHGIFPAHDFYYRWLTTQFILYGGM